MKRGSLRTEGKSQLLARRQKGLPEAPGHLEANTGSSPSAATLSHVAYVSLVPPMGQDPNMQIWRVKSVRYNKGKTTTL